MTAHLACFPSGARIVLGNCVSKDVDVASADTLPATQQVMLEQPGLATQSFLCSRASADTLDWSWWSISADSMHSKTTCMGIPAVREMI